MNKFISRSQKTEKAEDRDQDLTVQVAEVQKRLNSQLQQVCFVKARTLIGKK